MADVKYSTESEINYCVESKLVQIMRWDIVCVPVYLLYVWLFTYSMCVAVYYI